MTAFFKIRKTAFKQNILSLGGMIIGHYFLMFYNLFSKIFTGTFIKNKEKFVFFPKNSVR